MSTSKRRIILGSVGAVAVTFVLAASSWSMSHGARHNPERMLERMTHRLDLSEQQQADIGALLGESHAQQETDRQRMKALKSSLKDQRSNFDAAALQITADEMGELTSRRIYARTSTQAQVYTLLSPEQREKMDEMHEKRKMRKLHKRAHAKSL